MADTKTLAEEGERLVTAKRLATAKKEDAGCAGPPLKFNDEGILDENLAYKAAKDGIEVKIKRVSDTGRHKVIDADCSGGSIKILANSSTIIPSGSAYITFDQKYTYAYGDNWIIE